LYISAGDSVLRYDLGAKKFLPPLVLGGELRGMDISPDNDQLAVADNTDNNGSIGIYLVDLNAGSSSHVTFRSNAGEGGTYSVAFGADNNVWITTTYHGSGWVPLRKYSPTGHGTTLMGTLSMNTMLSASADRQSIAFAEGNSSGGEYGRLRYRATQLPSPILRANAFLFEISANRDGSQMAVPTVQNVVLSGASQTKLDEPRIIGIAYHPMKDYLLMVGAGSPMVMIYETGGFTKVKDLDFGERFESPGLQAFQNGRLRLSADGAWVFCTVSGGIRYAATGL
jgi:hypothetical protein